MQGTPSSHIENLGLHGPQVAQKIADRGLSDLSHLADSVVGESRLDLAPMTDEEREQAAYRAGAAMQAWYADYQRTGNHLCLDLAYHFLGVQKTLLAGRSAEYVAKLEAERGLD